MYIIATDAFRMAAEVIANLPPCPIEGRLTADQVKIALVEHLDVVPACVLDDVAGDEASARLDGEAAPKVDLENDLDDLAATLAEMDRLK